MVKNILVAYDGSGPSYRALDFALDLAKKYDGNITVVTCVTLYPDVDPHSSDYASMLSVLKQGSLKTVSELEPKLKESKIAYKTEVIEAISVADAILNYSEKFSIDLIVMGSRGIGGFKTLLLGSVTNGVSQHSKCPVLIVK
ncbi:MAG: universal stress protein [Thaumarchaeota archaeon]|nr:universal stress protein [Nitrososphaerota archaeon]